MAPPQRQLTASGQPRFSSANHNLTNSVVQTSASPTNSRNSCFVPLHSSCRITTVAVKRARDDNQNGNLREEQKAAKKVKREANLHEASVVSPHSSEAASSASSLPSPSHTPGSSFTVNNNNNAIKPESQPIPQLESSVFPKSEPIQVSSLLSSPITLHSNSSSSPAFRLLLLTEIKLTHTHCAFILARFTMYS